MNMKYSCHGGFTLIELIVIIVLVGIVGSFMAVFFGSKIINAPDVLLISQREASVELVMEEIMAAYLLQINGANPDNALVAIMAQEAAFEDIDGDGTADLSVDFEYIAFSGAGTEQASAGATPNLKTTVFLPSTSGTGATNEQHRLTTILTLERTNAGGEPVVNF